MKRKILEVLTFLKEAKVDYADIRIVDRYEEKISTENLKVEDLVNSRSKGFGVRVIFHGAMGFASSQNFEELKETAKIALEIAKASRTLQKEKIQLSKKKVLLDHYATPIEIDPFTVSKAEKIQLLLSAERAMREAADLSRTKGSMYFKREEKTFADTEGSYITQELYESGAGIGAYASSKNDIKLEATLHPLGATMQQQDMNILNL